MTDITKYKLFSECACDAWYMPTFQESVVITHESPRLTTIIYQQLHKP